MKKNVKAKPIRHLQQLLKTAIKANQAIEANEGGHVSAAYFRLGRAVLAIERITKDGSQERRQAMATVMAPDWRTDRNGSNAGAGTSCGVTCAIASMQTG